MEQKKNPNKALEHKRGQYFALGLTISLALAIMAFEWKTPANPQLVSLGDLDRGIEDEMVFITKIPPPEPPKPKVVPLEVVETEEEPEEIEEILVDVEMDSFDPDEEIIIPDAPVEEVEEIVVFAEKMPMPKGGFQSFYNLLAKEMKYPKQARGMGVEGKVFLQFVVDKSGEITDIEVVRGIGSGCDEEALRVMALVPAWNPGKQSGRPVKVRMIVPIHFRLHQ